MNPLHSRTVSRHPWAGADIVWLLIIAAFKGVCHMIDVVDRTDLGNIAFLSMGLRREESHTRGECHNGDENSVGVTD